MQSNKNDELVTFDKNIVLQDMYRLIETQQATIAKLNSEISKRTQNVSRDAYEQCLNEFEKEKYDHAKTKLSLMDTEDRLKNALEEVEFYKLELDRERKAYENVFSLLKDKALDESTKSIDMMEKIVQSDIRYNEVLQNIVEKEKLYEDLYTKLKKKEKTFESKISEINLKSEQEKYINRIFENQNDSVKTKSKLKK